MSRIRAMLSATVAGAALLVSSAVMAQTAPSGGYLGIGVGSGTAKDFCDTGGAPIALTSCDDKANGWKILGGYQVSKNLAFEAAYSIGSDFTASATLASTPVSVKASANFLEGTVIGMLPLGDRFALLGKFGLVYWDLEVSASAMGVSVSESDSGIGLTYGVGAQFDFTPKFGMRAEYQMYPSVGDQSTTGETDVSVLSASVYFRF
jgi:OOP family OmpA-OmpF porin